MKILITNDDGISAPGIQALAKSLAELPDISLFVSAPAEEQSGKSQAVTINRHINVEQFEIPNLLNVTSFKVGGTPVDCVRFAIEKVCPQPDLVISGINQGANYGSDVHYSGTVGAAKEAAFYNVPSMAVSLCCYESKDFSVASTFIRELVAKGIYKDIPKGVVYNINVPAITKESINGAMVTRLGHHRYEDSFNFKSQVNGISSYLQNGSPKYYDKDYGTDIGAIEAGFISITPLQFKLTATEMVNQNMINLGDFRL